MEQSNKEFNYASSSILVSVLRGIVVGLAVGLVVSLFRLFIGHSFEWLVHLYQMARQNLFVLFAIAVGYFVLTLFIAFLAKGEKGIRGSGIPQVEGELKGLMTSNWWEILWRKFMGGMLAISSGLMLGREGPSIQLGAMTAKGVASHFKLSPLETRVLIASGAAAGLSAAFNAPIAGLLFVIEEVYRHFSRLVWITTLTASLVANAVSQWMFGLSPALHLPISLPALDFHQYWLLILTGAFLGLAGYVYERVILAMPKFYKKMGDALQLTPDFYPLIPFSLIMPIGLLFPKLLGGGHELIVHLPHAQTSLTMLLVFFVIRFCMSMLSYGSGLPGGIFLPILALGSVLGLLIGHVLLGLGLIVSEDLPLFIVLGMAGYFGAISKAPLTGIVLVTEMVGDMQQLMPIGIVMLSSYIVMDLCHGVPIYEAMLEKMLPEHANETTRVTLIEIPVSEKIAGRRVADLTLPDGVLITGQGTPGHVEVVNGQSKLYLGNTIHLVVQTHKIDVVKSILLD
ncbi:ClC family H(+)/Cl(-) exchange transporter [Streptococcus ovuberis]|uniref:ClC family H(+)/Cl(-) exchange transporter n=1 Tax=Streptococcus ovuberis TaxID=1936207 RepID=A0A7X6MZE7_9STRE|nr:ClC family H(+)/Cl(-) exchange transporter [Streptococcus ovuberis]NKZ20504.1 ClC family H(+)/Cl(-) exchange transporter [Streptococcus ovuberis]